MTHPLLASTSALAALLVAAVGFAGPWATAGVAALLVIGVALGWPQLLGAPARTSLTLTLSLTGLAGVAAVALWPGRRPGMENAEFGGSLIEPLAVAAALGILASFMVQLLRGTGRPQRLESTAGTITGVAVVVSAAGWVVLARYDAGPLTTSLGLSLALAALAGMVPLHGRVTRWLGHALSVVLAAAVPLALAAVWPAAWPQLPLGAAVVGGVLGAIVVVLMGRLAPDEGRGRPIGQRAAVALGLAPVTMVGLLAYFVLSIIHPT